MAQRGMLVPVIELFFARDLFILLKNILPPYQLIKLFSIILIYININESIYIREQC